MTKQWLWYDDDSATTQGAILDFDDGIIQWINQPGCACGDDVSEQSFADFLARGARYLAPPSDVSEAMHDAIQQHQATIASRTA